MQIRSFSSFPVKLNSSLPKAGPYLRYLLKIPTNLKLHSNNLADPPKATEKPLYHCSIGGGDLQWTPIKRLLWPILRRLSRVIVNVSGRMYDIILLDELERNPRVNRRR